jgi:hypothetical protein
LALTFGEQDKKFHGYPMNTNFHYCVQMNPYSNLVIASHLSTKPTDNKNRQAGKHAHKNQKTNEKTNENVNSVTTCKKGQQKQQSKFLQEYKSKTSYTPEDGHVGRNM